MASRSWGFDSREPEVEISSDRAAAEPTMNISSHRHMASILQPFAEQMQGLVRSVDAIETKLAENGEQLARHSRIISGMDGQMQCKAEASDTLRSDVDSERQSVQQTTRTFRTLNDVSRTLNEVVSGLASTRSHMLEKLEPALKGQREELNLRLSGFDERVFEASGQCLAAADELSREMRNNMENNKKTVQEIASALVETDRRITERLEPMLEQQGRDMQKLAVTYQDQERTLEARLNELSLVLCKQITSVTEQVAAADKKLLKKVNEDIGQHKEECSLHLKDLNDRVAALNKTADQTTESLHELKDGLFKATGHMKQHVDPDIAENKRSLAELRSKHEELHSGVHELVNVAMSATAGVQESLYCVTDSVGRSLNESDANARTMQESLTQLNAVLLKTNNTIVEKLKPDLEAQKEELSKLNTLFKDNVTSVGKRLDQVASATDVLQCKVDQQFTALNEMGTSVAESNNKMSESFETALKRHHLKTEDISAKLEETNAKIKDRLEHAVDSQHSEICLLKTLQQGEFLKIDARLKHCDMNANDLHQSVTQVNEKLSNLHAAHQEDLNNVGKKLDTHSEDLIETKNKISETLEPTLEQHHLEMQAVSSRLAETSTKINDRLEPAMKSHFHEISSLKAVQQDHFQNVDFRLNSNDAAAKAQSEEISKSNKKISESLEPFLQRHHKELQQIASQVAETNASISKKLEPEISKLRTWQQETFDDLDARQNNSDATAKVLQEGINQVSASVVATHNTLDSHQQDISELKALRQHGFTSIDARLDKNDMVAKGLHESMNQVNGELSKLNTSCNDRLDSVGRRLDQADFANEALQGQIDQHSHGLGDLTADLKDTKRKMSGSLEPALQRQRTELKEVASQLAETDAAAKGLQASLSQTKQYMTDNLEADLRTQKEELSKLSTSHRDGQRSVNQRLNEFASAAETLKARADQDMDRHRAEMREVSSQVASNTASMQVHREELSKLSCSHQESLQAQTEELSKLKSSNHESLKFQKEEILQIQNVELSKLSAAHQERLSSMSNKLDQVTGTAEELRSRADQQQESLQVQKEELLQVQNEELSKLSALHQERLISVSKKLQEVTGTAEELRCRADQQQESLRVQKEEILQVQNDELSKLSASQEERLGSVRGKLDEVTSTAEVLKGTAEQHADCFMVVASGLSDTKSRVSESPEPALEKHRKETRRQMIRESEERSGPSQSGAKLREMMEQAVTRHHAELQEATARLSEMNRLEITKLKALHLLDVERIDARLNGSDANAKATHESLTQLNTILLKTNSNIIEHLEPGLEAQKDELSKLNSSHKDCLHSVEKRLEQVVSATEVLKCRVDQHTDSLKEVASGVFETKSKISDSLEPALEKHREETRSHLRTVHEQLDATGGHIHRLNDETKQQMHKARKESAGHSTPGIQLREMLDLALEKQHTEMREVMSRLAATDEKHTAEISKLKAMQQSNFASMESQLRDENAATEALRKAVEEVSSGLAATNKGIVEKLEPNLKSQNEDFAKLQALQESQLATMESQLQEEIAAVQALHKVVAEVGSGLAATNNGMAENVEPMLKAHTKELSKLRALHFDSFNGMNMRLDEVHLIAHTLRDRANQQTASLCDVESRLAETNAKIKAKIEPFLDAQREEMTGRRVSHQDKITKMEAKLNNAFIAAEELSKQLHHVNAGLSKTDAHIAEKLEGDLRHQNEELSRLATLYQDCFDGINKKLEEIIRDNGAKTVDLEESNSKMKEAFEHALGRHGDDSRKNLDSIEARLQHMTEESRGIAETVASLREHGGGMDTFIADALVIAESLKEKDRRMQERTNAVETLEKTLQSHRQETKEILSSIDGRLQSTAHNMNERLEYNERLVQGVTEKLNEDRNCASAAVQLAEQCESLKSEARVSMERLDGLDRRLEDSISTTASLQEALAGSNGRIAEMNSRLSAAICRTSQIEPSQEKQNEELSRLSARHQETRLRLDSMDERMRNFCIGTDKMRDTMNSIKLRVERVEPEQERQRENVLQINTTLEVSMRQITASQRLGEENHRKFRLMAEARERIDLKDQETFDSLNASVAQLSLLLKETVHRVNTHASHLKLSSSPIRPGSARPCSERFDGSLPYRPTSHASTRREGSSSCSWCGNELTMSPFGHPRPVSRPASPAPHEESRVLKQEGWAVPSSKEARQLPEIQQHGPTKTA